MTSASLKQAARLISAGTQAVEAADEAQTQEDLRRAGNAFAHFMEVLAVTPVEDQRLAMDSRDERGNPPPTLADAFEAYREAGLRVFDRCCLQASA